MTFRISDNSDSVGKQDKIKDYIKDEEMGNLTMLNLWVTLGESIFYIYYIYLHWVRAHGFGLWI